MLTFAKAALEEGKGFSQTDARRRQSENVMVKSRSLKTKAKVLASSCPSGLGNEVFLGLWQKVLHTRTHTHAHRRTHPGHDLLLNVLHRLDRSCQPGARSKSLCSFHPEKVPFCDEGLESITALFGGYNMLDLYLDK